MELCSCRRDIPPPLPLGEGCCALLVTRPVQKELTNRSSPAADVLQPILLLCVDVRLVLLQMHMLGCESPAQMLG
jgi:hypothetical protein